MGHFIRQAGLMGTGSSDTRPCHCVSGILAGIKSSMNDNPAVPMPGVEIVLDHSVAMADEFSDGTSKLKAAAEAIHDKYGGNTEGQLFTLRQQQSACDRDSELPVDFGEENMSAVRDAIKNGPPPQRAFKLRSAPADAIAHFRQDPARFRTNTILVTASGDSCSNKLSLSRRTWTGSASAATHRPRFSLSFDSPASKCPQTSGRCCAILRTRWAGQSIFPRLARRRRTCSGMSSANHVTQLYSDERARNLHAPGLRIGSTAREDSGLAEAFRRLDPLIIRVRSLVAHADIRITSQTRRDARAEATSHCSTMMIQASQSGTQRLGSLRGHSHGERHGRSEYGQRDVPIPEPAVLPGVGVP